MMKTHVQSKWEIYPKNEEKMKFFSLFSIKKESKMRQIKQSLIISLNNIDFCLFADIMKIENQTFFQVVCLTILTGQ